MFSSYLDHILDKNKKYISVEDYNILLISFEIMKKSYLYWSSKEKGGIGEGYSIILKMDEYKHQLNKITDVNILSMKKRDKTAVEKVIIADGMGAAGAFIGNAYFWAGGPASYFGSVAFSAAFSSAMGSWAL